MQGYQGAQTLARLVTYDSEIQELVFYPTEESKRLRSSQQVNTLDNLTVDEQVRAPAPYQQAPVVDWPLPALDQHAP